MLSYPDTGIDPTGLSEGVALVEWHVFADSSCQWCLFGW